MKNRKMIALISVSIAGALTLGGILGCGISSFNQSGNGSSTASGQSQSASSNQNVAFPTQSNGHVISEDVLDKIDQLAAYINTAYLYADEIDLSGLGDAMYAAFIDFLDEPYTCYYNEEEYSDLLESTDGSFSGIGATMTQDAETGEVIVLYPMENSPAKEAGLEAGDVITGVSGLDDISTMELSDIVSGIRGEEGTDVTLTIYRESTDETFDVTITRRTIEYETVTYEMLEDNVGHIEIWQFDTITTDQFDAALEDLESQGMEALILDLRDNPGGVVTTAVDVLDAFLDKQVAVYTLDKNETKKTYTTEAGTRFDGPVVVLINGNSASASEIVTGALQDYGIAVVMGTTSYGKGIMQGVYPLGDGTGLKMTVSDYYTPNGRNIHGTGIEPDITVEADAETETDEQLEAALEYLRK